MKISSMSSEMYLPPKRVGNANEADTAVMAEIDSYTHICATFDASQYVDPKNDGRYDILRFWDAHKKILPIHYTTSSLAIVVASVHHLLQLRLCTPVVLSIASPRPLPNAYSIQTLSAHAWQVLPR